MLETFTRHREHEASKELWEPVSELSILAGLFISPW